MDNNIFNKLQRLGRSFMLPIALLPMAGLFLGLGSGFTNSAFITQYNLEALIGEGTIIYSLLTVMTDVGEIVFANLALLFAISVASSLAKDRKEVAALSAVVGYFSMYAALTSAIHNFQDIDALQKIEGLVGNVLGFEETLNMGVFGGIIIGLVVVSLHNKFYRVKFTDTLSFFQGTHFIPIISAIAGTILGFFFSFIWPFIGAAIASLGALIVRSGAIGSFLYGFIYRALIPFGLHHVFYLPFWQTALGGSMEVAGEMIHGAQNIVFAQLAAGEAVAPEFAKYFSFQFPLMIGGWPAAALAIYHLARKENKDEVKGLLFGSSLTSILTGITEPIEFTVLFASPFLFYGVHSVLAGFSVILVEWLNAGVGLTFSGGLIDFIIYGVIPGNERTNWMVLVPLIAIWAIVYYTVFRLAIVKFQLKTPGRELTQDTLDLSNNEKNLTRDHLDRLTSDDELSLQITNGLGGLENIDDFTNCATRLRVTVNDGDKVNENLLRQTGAAGVVLSGRSVQVIYGTKVEGIAGDLNDFLQSHPDLKQKKKQVGRQEKNDAEPNKKGPDHQEIILSPMSGDTIALKNVNDDIFREKTMGDGVAILPTNGKVYAPVTGQIVASMETNHAVGIRSDQGAEILIHIGLDTVKMKGEGFTSHIKKGDQVTAGDLLIEADLDKMIDDAYDPTTMIIITNSADYLTITTVADKSVQVADPLLDLRLK